MNVDFLQPAEAEFIDAVTYYTCKARGWAMNLPLRSKERSDELSSIRTLGPYYRSVLVAAQDANKIMGRASSAKNMMRRALRVISWDDTGFGITIDNHYSRE